MATDGCYEIKSKSGGTHTVDICNGVCTCKSLTLQQILCKHMFAAFSQSNWSWNDLPKSLTNSVNLTLEELSFSMDVKDEEMDEKTVPDMGIPEESNYSNMTDPIPIQQSSENRLLKTQKHTRDSLAKCISVVFTIDDVSVWRSCTTWLFHQPSPVMDWIYLASHYCKKLELQNTGKRWGCRRKQSRLLWSTKSVNRNHKPPVNQSDIVYVMSHSVSAWRILLEDQRRKSVIDHASFTWPPLPPLFSLTIPKQQYNKTTTTTTTTKNSRNKSQKHFLNENKCMYRDGTQKTNQTRWEWYHNTFTPFLHLEPFKLPTMYMHTTKLSTCT